MSKILKSIKNFIQLRTSDMEDKEYVELMRSVVEWANSQADATECRIFNNDENDPTLN